MTARALRVGVVLNGNLVEERLFADASKPITIGQSLRCRLSVPADGMPSEHALFVRDQGKTLLCLGERMTARIATGGSIQTDVRGTLAVERGTRGKVQIGDATILFQEVAAPAAVPKPQLPAALRGSFADRIDRRLAVIVGASIFMHAGLGAWAWMGDVEEDAPMEQARRATFTHETITMVEPDVALPMPSQLQPGAATPAAPQRQTPAPIVKPSRITPNPGKPSMTGDDAQRFAQMLTNEEAREGGKGGMSNRLPGGELANQINDIRDNNRTIGNDQAGFRTRPREGIGTGDNQIVDNAPTNIETQQPRPEREVGGRIVLQPTPTTPGDTPTPELILAKIRNVYMNGLIHCYKKGLVDQPSLSGKVNVSFTVTETGSVTSASARGLEKQVDACITSQMATWRFPVSKDKDGDAVELDIALTLALVPSN